MKYLKKFNEEYILGPGGFLNDDSTNKDKFIYRINELTFLKDRFDLYLDKITDEFIDENLEELSNSINNIHNILNKIK